VAIPSASIFWMTTTLTRERLVSVQAAPEAAGCSGGGQAMRRWLAHRLLICCLL